MTGRRLILGMCMLSALALSAAMAQGASAATKGTTAFTCTKSATGVGEKFKAAHCKEADTSSTGEWRHVEITENTTTELEGSNETTNENREVAKLASTQAGVELELQAGIVEKKPGTTPWMKNLVNGKEHYVFGEGEITYTEVSVAKPGGKGCKVFEVAETNEGMVTTKKLKATSKELPEVKGVEKGMAIKFEPAEGTVFAEFNVVGCSKAELNGVYKAEGSLQAVPDGATLVTTVAGVKEQGTLKLRGQLAGYGGSLTLEGRDPEKDPANQFTPLSATTVETT